MSGQLEPQALLAQRARRTRREAPRPLLGRTSKHVLARAPSLENSMTKVSVMFMRKESGSEPYSSEGYHVALETEPPPEVASDRQRLANYIMALASEARARVEEALASGRVEQQEREHATAQRPTTAP